MEIIIALAIVAVVAIAAVGWLTHQLTRQQIRLAHQLDTLAQRAAINNIPAGEIAPPFELKDLSGARTTLARLLTAGKPLLLFFTDPRCSPCYALLPDVGGWQRIYGDRLSIALVSGGTPEANSAMTGEYGIAPGSVLLQTDREVAEAYGVNMMPAALLIRPDGRRSGDVVYGTHAVRQIVADTLGLLMPEAPTRQEEALRAGERVPTLHRPNLDGNAVDLGALRGESTLLLFWSPGCSHCQELLPDMKSWEADPNGPRMLIVSRGPVELNRAAELRSTIVLDDDGSIGARFGVRGTPAGIVIDELGLVASGVAAGTNDLRALVERRFASAATAAD